MEFTFIDAVNDLCCLPFDLVGGSSWKDRYRSRHHRWSVGRLEFVAVDSTTTRFVDDGDNIFNSSPTNTCQNIFRLCQNTSGVLLSAWR